MSPAMPAAHLVWPICDLTDPSVVEPGTAPRSLNTSVSVASSVRSPTTVPVPWASTSPTAAGETPEPVVGALERPALALAPRGGEPEAATVARRRHARR